MKRNIIIIDEDKCNGCGLCIPNCPEGAIQVLDGIARLISDLFCDGLGACIGYCPEEAIEVIEREAEPYSERKTMYNIIKGGEIVIKAHLKHLNDHGEQGYLDEALSFLREEGMKIPVYKEEKHEFHGGCPGIKIMDFTDEKEEPPAASGSEPILKSELRQWPIQLKLLSPFAPYFKNAHLAVAADCVPFAYPAFHGKLLKGKALVIFCPKLDGELEEYVEKLSEIIKNNDIKSLTAVHMEVPCCFGTVSILEQALAKSGKKIPIENITISIKGEIIKR